MFANTLKIPLDLISGYFFNILIISLSNLSSEIPQTFLSFTNDSR